MTDGVDPARAVRQLTGGRGVDAAIEAVGTPATWEMAVQMVRKGGKVNFFGGCPSDSRISLDTSAPALLRDHLQGELPPHAGATSGAPWRLSAQGNITAQDFVKSEEPLTNLLEVMRYLTSHNGHLKTAIIP